MPFCWAAYENGTAVYAAEVKVKAMLGYACLPGLDTKDDGAMFVDEACVNATFRDEIVERVRAGVEAFANATVTCALHEYSWSDAADDAYAENAGESWGTIKHADLPPGKVWREPYGDGTMNLDIGLWAPEGCRYPYYAYDDLKDGSLCDECSSLADAVAGTAIWGGVCFNGDESDLVDQTCSCACRDLIESIQDTCDDGMCTTTENVYNEAPDCRECQAYDPQSYLGDLEDGTIWSKGDTCVEETDDYYYDGQRKKALADECYEALASPLDGDDDACEDDASWYVRGKPDKGCAWIAKKPDARCAKKSDERVVATSACPSACDACDACADDVDWYVGDEPRKSCAWIAKKPDERCRRKDADGERASSACPVACDACDDDDASGDSESWSLKGNPTKGCKWVDRKPDDRCGKKSHDLVRAYDACPSACAAYVSASSAVHDAAHLTPWAAEAVDVLKGAGLV